MNRRPRQRRRAEKQGKSHGRGGGRKRRRWPRKAASIGLNLLLLPSVIEMQTQSYGPQEGGMQPATPAQKRPAANTPAAIAGQSASLVLGFLAAGACEKNPHNSTGVQNTSGERHSHSCFFVVFAAIGGTKQSTAESALAYSYNFKQVWVMNFQPGGKPWFVRSARRGRTSR